MVSLFALPESQVRASRMPQEELLSINLKVDVGLQLSMDSAISREV